MKLLWSLIAATAIAGVLVSCNQQDRKPPEPPEKVTIACSTSVDGSLAHVALKRGFYRQEGLDATMQKYTYGKLCLDAVLAGKADFATVAETPVMFAVMNSNKIAVIAAIERSTSNNEVIARRDRDIAATQDLKGKRIGITYGTISEFYMDSFLAISGLNRRDVTLVHIKPEEMADSLERMEIDAVSTWSDNSLKVQRRFGDRVITFSDKDIYTQTFLLVATQEYIKKYPQRVRKMLHALLDAEQFVKENMAGAQSDVADFSGVDKSIITELWDKYDFTVSLDQPLILALEAETRWAMDANLIPKQKVPNYLDVIYLDGLATIKPNAVRILK